MLVRAYRLTDKTGIIFLKTCILLGEWLLDGMSVLLNTIFLPFVLVIRWVFVGLFTVLMFIVTGIVWLFNRVLGLAGIGAVSIGSSTASATSQAMARRKAREELESNLTEDPLLSQNRVLSVLVVILGIIIIGVLLWATSPDRNTGVAVANNPGAGQANLLFDVTQEATNEAESVAIFATPIPTATQIPSVLEVRGALAFVLREGGQQDIWVANVGSRNAVRLTNDPSDERDPAWSPDGRRLAYASRKDGNWELYVLEIANPETPERITFDLSFQGNPQWSPDGNWLVYESYQGGNLDIYALPLDGSQPLRRITDHPAPDYAPVWSPEGRQMAFVSVRDGNQDVYIFDLDTLETSNITNTPSRNENHPAWSSDGELLAYSAVEQGREQVFVQAVEGFNITPQAMNFGRTPSWSPEGLNLTFAVDTNDSSTSFIYAIPYQGDEVATEVLSLPTRASDPTWTTRPLPAQLVNDGGVAPAIAQPIYIEQETRSENDPSYFLFPLLNVQTTNPALSDRVNDSFNALREKIAEKAGWDYLAQLEDAFWDINRLPQPGEERLNWHKTGRAFSILKSSIRSFPPPIEIVQEQVGVNTYWRVYLRVSGEAQSGELGEPLRYIPWDLLSSTQGDVEAFNQGGRLRAEVPSGYYIDLTQIAHDYGWERVPAGSDWRANSNSVNYWAFQKRDGLDWYSAMREIYTEGQLGGFAQTQAGA